VRPGSELTTSRRPAVDDPQTKKRPAPRKTHFLWRVPKGARVRGFCWVEGDEVRRDHDDIENRELSRLRGEGRMKAWD
jgi:hypothetical protein